MFKDIIELDKQVVDRIVDKVHENNLEIEMEMGVVKDGMVKVLFLYPLFGFGIRFLIKLHLWKLEDVILKRAMLQYLFHTPFLTFLRLADLVP